MATVTKVKGELEVQHDRGVVYFHFIDEKDVIEYRQMTPLRISGIDKPIPLLQTGNQIDLHADQSDYTSKPVFSRCDKISLRFDARCIRMQNHHGKHYYDDGQL